MNTLLTPEDSKRVADALIDKIDDMETDFGLSFVLRDFLLPSNYKRDWLPVVIEHMCDRIVTQLTEAAYACSEKLSERN